MIYPPDVLDALQTAVVSAWQGTVYRHMFGTHPPERRNTTGARWNSPPAEAIYASLERETALAEAAHYISLQPLRPKAKRTLYTIEVSLGTVVDLSQPGLIKTLGITDDVLRGDDHALCRLIGNAVNWLGHDALLVPSARRLAGTNFVIFKQDLSKTQFAIVADEVIADDERAGH
jgi:RES domain-containing protein